VEDHTTLSVAFRILIKMLDPAGVEGAASPDDPMDLVAFLDEELCQVAAVLTGDAGNECDLTSRAAVFKSHFVFYAVGSEMNGQRWQTKKETAFVAMSHSLKN
jgi:hypothetical protein